MTEVTILTAFTGYPNGERTEFTAGSTVSLEKQYAALLVEKGLAQAKKAKERSDD